MMEFLQEKGLSLEARTREGATILHVAASGTHSVPPAVHYLVERGLGPLERDYQGRTAFHYAAAACNSNALEALIKALQGIDYTKNSRNSISDASPDCEFDRSTLTKSKIDGLGLRAILDDADSEGNTLLHVIGSEKDNTLFTYDGDNKLDEQVIQIEVTTRMLIGLGADMNIRNNAGQTPLSSLVSMSVAPHSGIIAAKTLLSHGVDPDIPDLCGQTPLHRVARSWYTEAMELLLQGGANIEARDRNGCSPLHLACRHMYSQVPRLLLQHKANPAARDVNEATPLHYAAESMGSSECIDMLAKVEADLNVMDKSGLTPLHWLIKAGLESNVWYLLYHGADAHVLSMFAGPLFSWLQPVMLRWSPKRDQRMLSL